MVRGHVRLMLEMMDTYAPATQDTVEPTAKMVSIFTFTKLVYIIFHIMKRSTVVNEHG